MCTGLWLWVNWKVSGANYLSMHSPGVLCNILLVFKPVDDIEGVANVATQKLDPAPILDVWHSSPPVVDESHDSPEDHVALFAGGDRCHVVHFGSVDLEETGKGKGHATFGAR